MAPGALRQLMADTQTEGIFLVLDYDHGVTPDEASMTWEPWFHLLHSTWSHRDDEPRFDRAQRRHLQNPSAVRGRIGQ